MKITMTEHCLRNIKTFSRCQQCVDICDRKAISVQSGKPEISESSCNQCGQCVLACPVQAIAGELPVRQLQETVLFSSGSSLPTVRELLLHYAAGIRAINIANVHESQWLPVIAQANTALKQLREQSFQVTVETRPVEKIMNSRRSLLRLNQIKKTLDNAPLAIHFPRYQFFTAEPNTKRCSLCRLCERVCPTQAIFIDEGAFHFAGTCCTGCKLCADGCPEQAITVKETMVPRQIFSWPVAALTCSRCESVFSSLNTVATLCPACQLKETLHIPPHAIGQASLMSDPREAR